MDTLLIVLAIILLAAAIIVLVVALRRPKKDETPAARQDPLGFSSPTPEFGPRQLGPGAIISHGGIDYVPSSLRSMPASCSSAIRTPAARHVSTIARCLS